MTGSLRFQRAQALGLACVLTLGVIAVRGDLAPQVSDLARSAAQSFKLPLRFEENRGQVDARMRYLVRGKEATAFFASDRVVFTGAKGTTTMRPVGASPDVRLVATERLAGVTNHITGRDPSKWVKGAGAYGTVRYEDLWPGIDLVFHEGSSGALEYDLIVAPGSRSTPMFEFDGAKSVRIVRGALVVRAGKAKFTHKAPVAYQTVDGRKRLVDVAFRVTGTRVSFDVGRHDASLPLVIDPEVLDYSTYLGGTGGDQGRDLFVDGAGNAFIVGYSSSTDYPVCTGADTPAGCDAAAFDSSQSNGDVIVTKLDPTGSELVYSTFVGGSDDDYGLSIAVDGAGAAYVAGESFSTDFPVCTGTNTPVGCDAGSFQQTNAGDYDGIVFKLAPDGDALDLSTYLGGTDFDEAAGITVDSSGRPYITGGAVSSDFPVCTGAGTPTGCTALALDATHGGSDDAFVTKLAADGSALVYSTFLSGSASEWGNTIAVNSSGSTFVAGYTSSTGFPVCTGAGVPTGCVGAAFDATTSGGTPDGFVTKLSTDGNSLVYSTFLGGSSSDQVNDIALDASGNAYVGGKTSSSGFPVCPSDATSSCNSTSFDTTFNSDGPTLGSDGFLAKLEPTGGAIDYSTFIGGAGTDEVTDIVLDSASVVHLAGTTSSPNYPVCKATGKPAGCDSQGFDTSLEGVSAIFATTVNALGNGLGYSTVLDGTGTIASSGGVGVDASDNTYVLGKSSDGYPVCTGVGTPRGCTGPAFDQSFSSAVDTVMTKLAPADYQPDGLIQLKDAASFKGDGRYNTDAKKQTVETSRAPGSTARFSILFENDGTEDDSYLLKGCASGSGFVVTYRNDLNTDITTQVREGTYPVGITAGDDEAIEMRIKPTSTASGSRRCTVRITSDGDPSLRDVVAGTVKVTG
jgi:hypothetical protein